MPNDHFNSLELTHSQELAMRNHALDDSEQSPLIRADLTGAADPELDKPSYSASTTERWTAYLCFLVLGATVLLPWNLLIVVTPYFGLRLRSSSFGNSASSWVPLIFTVANLALLGYATYSQKKSGFRNIERKIFGCIGIIAGMIAVLLATTTMTDVQPVAFFVLLLLVSVTGAGVSAVLQSGSAALASIFEDTFYLQGVMSGQGAIGFAVSITQFLAAMRSEKSSFADEGDEKLVNSTWTFFLVSLLFTVVAAAATVILFRLPVYRASIRQKKDIDDEPGHGEVSLSVVNKKIQSLGLALAYIFTVTIGLFPGITASVAAVNRDSSISSDLLWVPGGFVVFNSADWLGRALPGFRQLVFTDRKRLVTATLVRTAFIPLILLCNVRILQDGLSVQTPFINSDLGYIVILALFAISNGYLTSLLMMRAVMEPHLLPEEVDIASSIMLVYLTAGLAAGAVLSFALRAIIA